MWCRTGLIVIIATNIALALKLRCVVNYLVPEKDAVGIIVYMAEGGDQVNALDSLVQEAKLSWTVIDRSATQREVIGYPGNYFIAASGDNEELIIEYALRNLTSFEDAWDPSARVILILSTPIPYSSYRSLATTLITKLWTFSIYDTIVMFESKDSYKDVLVYSANPFSPGNNCGKKANTVHNLRSCRDESYYKANRTLWLHPDVVRKYFDALINNEIDMSVGGCVIHHNYTFRVEFLRSHSQHQMRYYVANADPIRSWDVLHSMFSKPIWITLGVSLLVGGLCNSLLSANGFVIQRTEFLTLVAILLTQPIPRIPSRWRHRLFLAAFILPLYQISCLHFTALQSFMVHLPKNKGIMFVDDIKKANMNVLISDTNRRISTGRRMSYNHFITLQQPLVEALDELEAKRNFAIVARSLEVKFWTSLNLYRIHGLDESVAAMAIGFVMSKGNLYMATVEELALLCLESGLFTKWVADLTGIRKNSTKQVVLATGLEPLDMGDMRCSYIILLMGSAIASVIFAGEHVLNYCTRVATARSKKKNHIFVVNTNHFPIDLKSFH